MGARFKWDTAKARRNHRAHGISCEMAQEVFDDPNHIAAENYFIESEGEQRYRVIGMARNLALLLSRVCDRSTPGAEAIHIISARKAVAYEASIYSDAGIQEDQFR